MNEATMTTEYITRSYGIMRMGMTALKKGILGKIDSYSHLSPKSKCCASYADFAEDFGVSERQVARAIRELEKEEKIVREQRNGETSRYRSKVKREKGFVITPLSFYSREVEFVYENFKLKGKIGRTAVDVVCLMAAGCLAPDNNGKFEASVRQIAKMIGRSVACTQKALDRALHCSWLSRSVTSKGRKERSIYHVDSEILREIEAVYERKKASRAQNEYIKTGAGTSSKPPIGTESTKQKIPSAVDNLNAKTDRIRFYSLLQEKEQIRRSLIEAKLREDPDYKKAYVEYRKSEIELAKAEHFGDREKLEVLRRIRGESQGIMQSVQKRLKLDLTPRYRCKKCQDTGYRKDGKMCDCYPKGGDP